MATPYKLLTIDKGDGFIWLIEAVKEGDSHLIVDMIQWPASKELMSVISKDVIKHKSEDKSLIFVLKDVDDKMLSKANFSITPTISEAEDLLEMEEIERMI